MSLALDSGYDMRVTDNSENGQQEMNQTPDRNTGTASLDIKTLNPLTSQKGSTVALQPRVSLVTGHNPSSGQLGASAPEPCSTMSQLAREVEMFL